MTSVFLAAAPADTPATPIYAIRQDALATALASLPGPAEAFLRDQAFAATAGEVAFAPGGDGRVAAVAVGLGGADGAEPLSVLPLKVPEGAYAFADLGGVDPTEAAIAWGKGAYQFTRYKAARRGPAQLVWPDGCDAAEAQRVVDAVTLTRDLINTPTNDMGPSALEAAVRAAVEPHGAAVTVTTGDDLLEQNLPLIHAVGRAADDDPRLIEATWTAPDVDASAPRIVVVGKGVCFDTGGLNIKTGDFMRLMKKDMGGAAHAVALAGLIMDAQLPCRLHLLIPAVENSISDEAFRPGDILPSRKGLTVEIENTDAEGRLVLADALAKSLEEAADIVIDFATLTGAARVALGPELAPYFANTDQVAHELEAAAADTKDPIWRMPLYPGYRRTIESPIADIKNLGDGPFAGAIAAALFLERFVTDGTPWIHFDVFAWNPAPRPGRPKGGEAQGLRAAYGLLTKRLHSKG